MGRITERDFTTERVEVNCAHDVGDRKCQQGWPLQPTTDDRQQQEPACPAAQITRTLLNRTRLEMALEPARAAYL